MNHSSRPNAVGDHSNMLAAMMEFTNYLQKSKENGAASSTAWNDAIQALVLMIAPSAPHIAEEMWQRIGKPYSVHFQKWPEWSAQIAAEEKFTLIVQVNGKVRDRIELAMNVTEADVRAAALKSENAQKFLSGKPPRQVIYVAGRLVNIVT